MPAHVEIHHDVFEDFGDSNGPKLHFQNVTYHYETGNSDGGFRFIWSDEEGKYRGHRGQARIPSFSTLLKLLWLGTREGWLV